MIFRGGEMDSRLVIFSLFCVARHLTVSSYITP